MADEIKINDSNKERVAYDLTYDIASREQLYHDTKNYRKNILDLYAECIEATNNHRFRK